MLSVGVMEAKVSAVGVVMVIVRPVYMYSISRLLE